MHNTPVRIRRLSFREEGQIVERLLACPSIADNFSRETVLKRLHPRIYGSIARQMVNRQDVMNIVGTCSLYEGGLKKLIEIVAFFEDDSKPMQQLEEQLQFIFFTPDPPIISQELFGELLEIIMEVRVNKSDLMSVYRGSISAGWPFLEVGNKNEFDTLALMVRDLTRTDPRGGGEWTLLAFVRLLSKHTEQSTQNELVLWAEKAARAVGIEEQGSSDKTELGNEFHLFLARAPLTAQKLAGLLATVPVSMPVVRLIQSTMLPTSHRRHVEQVFRSGLLKVISENSEALDPDDVQYDFADGIRDALLEMVPASDKARILGEISDYIERTYKQTLDFRTLIAKPRTREGVSIGQESKPFARLAAKVLRRFGGEYVALADWLEEQEETVPSNAPLIPTTNELSSVASQVVTQHEPIINQNIRPKIYMCPSCFEEIYIGECRIVSGKTPGTVLKEAPVGWWERQTARLNPERLDTPQYTEEAAHHQCYKCEYLLPYNINLVPGITLAVIGDTFAGKSHYIAALLHQIQEEWKNHTEGYVRLTCLTPDVEKMYTKNYLEPLFENKQALPSTQTASNLTVKPLIYELSMHQSPDNPSTAINLLIYDAPGEDYEREERLVQYARFVFNSGAFIFTADPVRIMPIFQQFPSQLQDSLQAVVNLAAEQRAAERMNAIISRYESYYGYPEGSILLNIPIAVMVSKADLLKYLNLPDSYTFMKNPQYRGGVDLRSINKVDQEVRELLKMYKQGDLLTTTTRFKRVKFFATSATGEPPDVSGQFENVEPCRCLDPLLWILYEFGFINAAV